MEKGYSQQKTISREDSSMGEDFYFSVSREEAEKVNKSFTVNALKMMKGRYLQPKEGGIYETPVEMLSRVARALAGVEKNYGKNQIEVEEYTREFFDLMKEKKYTPAGRTVTNAGANTSLVANCIVLPIEDSMDSIFQTLKDASQLQQVGAGLGFDFSSLRPAMTPTKRTQGVSSGPVEFLKVYDTAFGIIQQQKRHGANMGMMSVEHPDVLDFIRAKEREGEIRNFNISIQLTDKFMKAVDESPNEQWYCEWRGEKTKPRKVIRSENGVVVESEEIDITAKEIFDEIVEYAWLNGEPGIFFIDEVNKHSNPLPGLGRITCTNPCGEQPLHPYDNCNLGSINLSVFVKNREIDWEDLKKSTRTAVRMMDNVIDLFDFPVKKVTDRARENRRIGLGVMGFADMLYKLGVPYDSEKGRRVAEKVMAVVNSTAHKTSQDLAKEKSPFPNINESIYGERYGGDEYTSMRNAALTTIAPTGSISMMLDCSSGIEPNFALAYMKNTRTFHADGGDKYYYLNQHLLGALKEAGLSEEEIKEVKEEVTEKGSVQHLTFLPEDIRRTFVVSMDISAEDHTKMQAAFQKHVDNSISKTINFPNSATREDIAQGYLSAWKLGCLSCTVYRDGSRDLQVLNVGDGKKKEEELKTEDSASEPSSEKEKTNGYHAKNRPEVMTGKTYRVRTGYGNLFVTINNDEDGRPFEVFATIGKTGGYFQEQTEGICRMISTALRAGVSVKEIIEQLKGIRGPMPTITKRGTVHSLPDAIGQVLEEHIGEDKKHELLLFEEKSEKIEEPKSVLTSQINRVQNEGDKAIANYGYMPACPECSSPLRMAEGCMSCSVCGFTRCE